MAASKQANIHMHMHNTVPLVWGLYGLTPTSGMIHRLEMSLNEQHSAGLLISSWHIAGFVTIYCLNISISIHCKKF